MARTAMRNAVLQCLAEHRIVLLLACSYISLGGVGLTLAGRAWPIRFTTTWFISVWGGASLLWLGWQYLRSPRKFWSALEPTRACGALLVAAIAVPIQITFQSLKQSIGPLVGFSWDARFASIDAAIHGGDAWRLLVPLVESHTWIRVVDRVYMSWFLLLVGFVTWLSWTHRRAVRRRGLVALLLLWIAGGTFGAALAASGGPCFYQQLGRGDRYRPLIESLDAHARDGGALMARMNQRGLWDIRTRDEWAQFAGISAMPSLHVAFAALAAIVVWQSSRMLGIVLAAYAFIIQVGSVALAWHYAIDGYVGAAAAVGAWAWAGRLCAAGRAGATVSLPTGRRLPPLSTTAHADQTAGPADDFAR